MFKKGDKVECIKDYPNFLTNGKIYIVEKKDQGLVQVKDDKGTSLPWTFDRFKLLNTTQTTLSVPAIAFKPVFKMGDKIQFINKNIIGSTLTVNKVYEALGDSFEPTGFGSEIVHVQNDNQMRHSENVGHFRLMNQTMTAPTASSVPTSGQAPTGLNPAIGAVQGQTRLWKKGDQVEYNGPTSRVLTNCKIYTVCKDQLLGDHVFVVDKDDTGNQNIFYMRDFKLCAGIQTHNFQYQSLVQSPLQSSDVSITIDVHGTGGECSERQAPIGQNHSHWCPAFKREF